jgi:anaerobic dimethyl sulfoxide reductase subunit C (anchor subunit)/Tat-targeted selenate reductase subunit YnfH
MQNALADLPLAIFTTLAPIGAGGFVALAAIFFGVTLDEQQARKLGKLSFIPLIVAALGFIASFFHLANPLHAFDIFNGLGTSPLTNEIAVGVVFMVLAFIYCLLAALGKLAGVARKGFLAVIAICALVFAAFCGLAYMIPTIPSWNTPLAPVGIMGFCLLGGALLGTLLLGLAGAFAAAKASSYKTTAITLTVLGTLLALIGVLGQLAAAAGIDVPTASGAALVSEVALFAVVFVVGALVALILQIRLFTGKGKSTGTSLAGVGLLVSVVAVFVARLAFYALEMNIGL